MPSPSAAPASPPAPSPLLAPLAGVLETVAGHREVALEVSHGSLPAFLLAGRGVRQALVLVEDADALAGTLQDLRSLAPPGQRVLPLPGPHILEGTELPLRFAEALRRLRVLDALAHGEALWAVATLEALLAPTASPAEYRAGCREIARGQDLERDDLLTHLLECGYRREDRVGSPGEVAVRGGILDVFPPSSPLPVRVELFGDEVEEIRTFDPATQRSKGSLDAVRLGPAWELPASERLRELVDEAPLDEDESAALYRALQGGFSEGLEVLLAHCGDAAARAVDYLEPDAPVASFLTPLGAGRTRMRVTGGDPEAPDPLQELVEAKAGHPLLDLGGARVFGHPGADTVDPGVTAAPSYVGHLERFLEEMKKETADGATVALVCDEEGRLARIRELLEKEDVEVVRGEEGPPAAGRVTLYKRDLARGFRIPARGFHLVAETDLWPDRALKRAERPAADRGARFSDFTEVETGCMVVHVDHGIGKFLGIRPLVVDGLRQDYLELEYAKGDRLFVPTSQLDRVQRFVGVEGGRGPKPSRLGGTRWAQQRARVRADVEQLAKELLALYAKREEARAQPIGPDTVWQQELEAGFPYEPTRDQARASGEIKKDLEGKRPMDRLLCGDVGFGKTEVAIRAGFKVVQDGMQVAVLCPTTVLAQQHYQTFTERLRDFPVRIGVLSRLRDPKEIRATLRRAKRGELDILIGTHRLLSKDVAFKNLGLLVIDEEQRFGVKHKERIKGLKTSVHVLTLTATPIPRTLNLALSGARDISTLLSPPAGRLPVKTFVQEYEDDLVRGAIARELARGGQVFFVHNRIDTLGSVTDKISKLVPGARVRGGHAQMDRHALESLMIDFYAGDFDVLVSTTIIENGLDIPNVNTILVDRADHMGMSQLYQLRGRVGRTTRQAYAYLLYPRNHQLTEIAFKRLKALEEFTELGSGFRVAMRDLELRGAGNILGADQHGFVNTVGFELYTRLLREAVARQKGSPEDAPVEPAALELPVHAYLPEEYIPSYEDRLQAYRTLSEIPDHDELAEYRAELEDRFGPIPKALDGLFRLVRAKILATRLGVASLTRKGMTLEWKMRASAELPQGLVDFLLRRYDRRLRFAANGLTLTIPEVPDSGTLDLVEDLLARAERHSA